MHLKTFHHYSGLISAHISHIELIASLNLVVLASAATLEPRSGTNDWIFFWLILMTGYFETESKNHNSVNYYCPDPVKAKHPHASLIPPPCFTVGMMFLLWSAVSFTPDVVGLMSLEEFHLLLFISPEKKHYFKTCRSSRLFLANTR